MVRPSFRDRVPGDCCCIETGYYDWYRDSASQADGGLPATTGTPYFVRVPSVIPAPPMYDGGWDCNPSTELWNISGSFNKTTYSTIAAGYQSTDEEEDDSEWVFVQETSGDDFYLKLYDCLEKEELDYYKYIDEYYDDYSTTLDPGVASTMNIWITEDGIDGGNQAGIGLGYSQTVRGVIDFNPYTVDGSGYFTTYDYNILTKTISKTFCAFTPTGLFEGIPISTVVEGSVTGIMYDATPQAVAPRNWPNAAGVSHVIYIYTTGPDTPTGCEEYTIYPKAELFVGDLSIDCDNHILGFEHDSENLVFREEDVGGLTGPIRYLIQFAQRHQVDVELFDSSPGGHMVLARYKWLSGNPSEGDCPDDASVPVEWHYYVRLYIGSTLIDEYETTSDWYRPWGTTCHAVHRHPVEDDDWLFCISSGQVDEFDPSNVTNHKICCYKSDGTKYWETVQSENTYGNGSPNVLWSSDRWIYVNNFILSTGTINEVTRGQWLVDDVHEEWLLSHNIVSLTGEDPIPLYVPAGIRADGELTPDWPSEVTDKIRYDTIKTSRSLPYAPPTGAF